MIDLLQTILLYAFIVGIIAILLDYWYE